MLEQDERQSIASDLPLVSIVTPSYNQGRFIRATIESVLSQDYPNLEYIVMDGASTDETAEVCAEYSDRLTFISEKDRGQSHAINKGFQRARGQIVAWLNSDDIFLPGAVTRAVEALLRETDVGAVYGNGFQIDAEGNVISRFAVSQAFDLWKLIHLSDYILQQTVFFRRTVFDRVGWLDESLHYGMDWEIFMRIGKEFPMRYLPYDMGSIREHGEAKTSSGGLRRVRELLQIMRRHSGEWWPPGFFVYGLPIFQQIAAHWIERLTPDGWFRRKARNATIRFSNWLVGRFVLRAQGWFGDGWAGRRAWFMFQPPRGRYVRLLLELPAWVPYARQTIAFSIGGKPIGRDSFGPGVYELFLALDPRDQGRALKIRVSAARWFVPAKLTGSPDARKLAYIVHEVGFANPR